MATEQRRWTLVRTSRGRFETHGPEVKPGESVPVVEAVLSPETFGWVARAVAFELVGPFPWGSLTDEAQDRCVRVTRAALRAAGFSEPSTGGDDATN